MKQPDLISLPVSGVQILVLDKPKVLESDPTWLLVQCQLCSDKRLMQLKWHRQGGRRFPMLLNTLKLRETLEVSGEFVMHSFVDNGVLVCNRSIIATNVEIYSSIRVVRDDGCKIPITTVEEARTEKNIEYFTKYLRAKIELDSLTEQMKGMEISKVITAALPATGKSGRAEHGGRTVSSREKEILSHEPTQERSKDFQKKRERWIQKSTNTSSNTISPKRERAV